ncbi:MAG: hypothetical protein IPL86_11900 [Flavobacteriales bacterium]|nr:hypothetical protein [Flavobacteriales bacterium]
MVNSNKITFQDFDLNSGMELAGVEVIRYKVPLIEKGRRCFRCYRDA